jgi:hypothetical protein
MFYILEQTTYSAGAINLTQHWPNINIASANLPEFILKEIVCGRTNLNYTGSST